MKRTGGSSLAGLAFAGVLCAHAAAYLIAAGGGASALLARTGHGYLRFAAAAAAGAAGCSLLAHTVRRLGAPTGESLVPARASIVWARLAALQCAMFLAIESGERYASHAPLATLFQNDLAIIGTILQLVVAAVTTALLWALARAAEAASRRPGGERLRPDSPALVWIANTVASLVPSLGAAGLRVRGPPRT